VIVSDTITCTVPDTAFVTIIGGPPTANVNADVSIGLGESTTLTASGGGTYNWYPNTNLNSTTNNTTTATPDYSTTYCVEVTATNGCKDTACVTVTVDRCPKENNLAIPNAFSPNNDNINDEFCLQGWNECVEDFIVVIYGRYGEKVFESTSPDFCWDGIYNGKIMDAQVFVYYIKATFANINEPIIKKGNISLIR
jgi:gliding motility-associated-like protein